MKRVRRTSESAAFPLSRPSWSCSGGKHVVQKVLSHDSRTRAVTQAALSASLRTPPHVSVSCVQIRIFARKSAIAANQGEYALNQTGLILQFFEDYYNISYPLPKSGE